jgi:hypothetical protein
VTPASKSVRVILFLALTLSAAPLSLAEDAGSPDLNDSKPKNSAAARALIIHRPALSPAWGRVIQYRKEQLSDPKGNHKETLHEFVLQDDAGIVRIAVFHENGAGDGYWEISQWDQP